MKRRNWQVALAKACAIWLDCFAPRAAAQMRLDILLKRDKTLDAFLRFVLAEEGRDYSITDEPRHLRLCFNPAQCRPEMFPLGTSQCYNFWSTKDPTGKHEAGKGTALTWQACDLDQELRRLV